MKIATKALTSLLIIALISLSSATASAMSSSSSTKPRADRRLERVYKHHDRKMELRASVLGITPADLREQLKTMPFESIIKKYGFKDTHSFYMASAGKVKDELKRRGWGDQKIDKYLQKRFDRLEKVETTKPSS